jgi:predicted SnoaL-like aldol condensation-catalyzing enzyme
MPAESVLAQWFRRVWNENDASAIDELAAPDVVSHGLIGDIHGREQWRQHFYHPMLAAFTHTRVEVLDEVVAGDKIFARLSATLSVAGHQETVEMKGTCLVRLVDGKIAEAWDSWDFLGLMEHLKILPESSFQKALMGKLTPHPEADT